MLKYSHSLPYLYLPQLYQFMRAIDRLYHFPEYSATHITHNIDFYHSKYFSIIQMVKVTFKEEGIN